MQYLNSNTNKMNIMTDEFDSFDLDLLWPTKEEKEIDIHTSSISDGLIYSLKNLGKVDINYISKITNQKPQAIIDNLKGSIYQDPTKFNGDPFEGFVTADEYLSGNLLKKLKEATFYNKKYKGYFENNINALKEVMPDGVEAGEIYFNISSPWIPRCIIVDFFKNTFVINPNDQEYIVYNKYTKQYNVKVIGKSFSYNANYKYGTSKMSAVNIFMHLLNNQSIAIYDTRMENDKKKRILNKDETALALNKAHELNNYFIEYVKKRDQLYILLTEAYNEKYGYVVSRIYDGGFLDFPSINPNVNLYKSQRDSIARIIFNNNTLLAHEVGSGKTYIMIASGMELLRMGISKKNLYVVPNNIISQWEADFNYLYPNSKSSLLVTDSSDYSPSKINDTLEKIKNGHYTSIIMPQSSFDNLKMSKELEVKRLEKKIEELDSIKDYNYFISKTKKIKELQDEIVEILTSPDKYIGFDELGITRLFLDEAHNYKNLPLNTSRGYIKGVNLSGSVKCSHLKSICEYLNSSENNGIIMATGTPISNSISDIYSIQSYLQEGELRLLDIKTFDNWLSMFTEEADELELDLDSTKYRVVKRLTKFHNLPELSTILASIAAFHYDKDADDLPKFNGYTDVEIKKSYELSSYIRNISERLEKIRKREVTSKEDNLLKITTDGRKAALDLRLLDEEKYALYIGDKISTCANNILNIYNKTKEFLGTQIVFCDTSVPTKDKFNVYDELKNVLVRYGIKDSEIAFIHNATTERKRAKLFENVNEGKIRIILGSTQKLGIGVNIQKRLYAIHHLDIPWRPSDMVQREGRILRQGNMNPEVFIYRYITQGSFDAYSWQILETKQKFINELLSNSLSERNRADFQESILTYSEIKALAIGNPKLKEHVEIKNKLERLRLLSKKQNDEVAKYKRELLRIPNEITKFENQITYLKQDILDLENNKDIALDKDGRNEFRKLVWDTLMDNLGKDTETLITTYKGFKIKADSNLIENNLYLVIENNGRYDILVGSSEQGILTRIENFFDSLPDKLESAIRCKNELISKKEALEENIKNVIDYSLGIEELNEKLIKLNKELKINE